MGGGGGEEAIWGGGGGGGVEGERKMAEGNTWSNLSSFA